MNVNIPVIEAKVRLEYMNQNLPEFVGKFAECQIFGMASIPGQTPLFHFLCDDGGVYWRMPIHAFCWRTDATTPLLEDVALWDSFSYHASVFTIDMFKNKRVSYVDRSKHEQQGCYLFTIDWFGDNGKSYGFSEAPGQHKCGHVLKLDNGNFAIQPNNRLKIFDPNFTVEDVCYPRMLARTLYSSEQSGRWRTANDEKYDYEIHDINGRSTT